MRAYRADGGELWRKPIPGIAWGVNISGNGKLVVAAYSDGTIRWHRLSDGQELLALFVHAKDRRYIAWTPQGLLRRLARRRRPHRLARQSRLRHRAGLLPRLDLRQHLSPPDIVKPRSTMWTRPRRSRRQRACSTRCGSCFERQLALDAKTPSPCPSPQGARGRLNSSLPLTRGRSPLLRTLGEGRLTPLPLGVFAAAVKATKRSGHHLSRDAWRTWRMATSFAASSIS